MKKYEFTGETINYCGITLKRIKRISDGLIGGFIEKEENLSHYGDCFVSENAKVSENAIVSGDAWVYGNANVVGNAWVFGNARVYGNADVYRNAWVYGDAQVSGNAQVSGKAQVSGNAKVFGNAQVYKGGCTKCLYIQQPRYDITITNNYIFIGCEGHTWEYWDENIEEIGENNGFTDREIYLIKSLLEILKQQIDLMR